MDTFFYLPLAQQIIDLFENHNISQCLKQSLAHVDNLCDIISGNEYKKLLASLPDCGANCRVTLTFNCDGVPVFLKFCLQCFDTVGWAAGRASGL